jgi:hypothetical protein
MGPVARPEASSLEEVVVGYSPNDPALIQNFDPTQRSTAATATTATTA